MIYNKIIKLPPPLILLLISSKPLAEEIQISGHNISRQWSCSFTMQGDKVYKELWAIHENNFFNISGKVTYYLPKEEENALLTYNAKGEWSLINNTLRLTYEPFDFESSNKFSSKYINDIETVYITPAFNGTRRFEYYIEKLSDSQMQIGDDYDSWKCSQVSF
ncbi:hypothetical protein [Photobacterium profundum]|nr:hypothetical protein [Photobacterium profundum]